MESIYPSAAMFLMLSIVWGVLQWLGLNVLAIYLRSNNPQRFCQPEYLQINHHEKI